MQHSPSREANTFSARQEIPRILWHQKIRYGIQIITQPVPILSQINLVDAFIQLPGGPF
jgi:hypothetical protein